MPALAHLRSEAARQFGQAPAPPRAQALIDWNGFDELEKQSAQAFYLGKSWPDVLADLRSPGGYHHLEEWSVLSREGLPYHLRAHLEYLFDTLENPTPDDEFIVALLGQLYQVVYMHKGSPFDAAQTRVLEAVVEQLAALARQDDRLDGCCDDIDAGASLFLTELKAHRR